MRRPLLSALFSGSNEARMGPVVNPVRVCFDGVSSKLSHGHEDFVKS